MQYYLSWYPDPPDPRYWEWFRRDGAKLRSGYFLNGEQVGEWTTYDKFGKVYKVTMMKPKKTKK